MTCERPPAAFGGSPPHEGEISVFDSAGFNVPLVRGTAAERRQGVAHKQSCRVGQQPLTPGATIRRSAAEQGRRDITFITFITTTQFECIHTFFSRGYDLPPIRGLLEQKIHCCFSGVSDRI